MRVTIVLFATLKDRAGTGRLPLDLPGEAVTVADVRRTLADRLPAVAPLLATAIAAVNSEYAFAPDPVRDGDEIAFFPPVSGGADDEAPSAWPEVFWLAAEPFDTDDLLTRIVTPATGASCLFSGYVRGETRRDAAGVPAAVQQTVRLEYEAYEAMAIAKMRQVAAEIRQRWPLVQGIAIVQRVGRLEVGQNTIVIACASGHRDQGCFEAARYGIDRLKEIVPVWKKEIRPNGSAWVEGDYLPTPADRE